ncbi:MAG: hypothetical protein QM709_02115 [Spongiibacteraceae bacterium]
MRRKVAVAVLTAALVGVVGAEGILKAREASLPKGKITVEEVEVVTVTANRTDDIVEQPSIAVASM